MGDGETGVVVGGRGEIFGVDGQALGQYFNAVNFLCASTARADFIGVSAAAILGVSWPGSSDQP